MISWMMMSTLLRCPPSAKSPSAGSKGVGISDSLRDSEGFGIHSLAICFALLVVACDMLCFACCCLRCALLCLLLLAICYGKNGGRERGQKWDSSDERNRVGKIAHLSPGRFFVSTEFQVWRGRIPEKWSKNGPFPLGGDCLERRDRWSTTG